MNGKFQCENCDEDFDHQPLIGGRSGLRTFCCFDCKNEAEDNEVAMRQYPPYDQLDHDFSMNH